MQSRHFAGMMGPRTIRTRAGGVLRADETVVRGLVIGLNGVAVSRYSLPILLIAAGLLVLVLAFLRSRSGADDQR